MHPFGSAQGAPPSAGLMFQPVTPGDRAVLFAFSQLGKPYIWGGNGPVGYDCSGLALASWQHARRRHVRPGGRRPVPHRRGTGTPAQLSAGDLVFWGTSQTDWTTVYHTALYVGGDQIVESTDGGVQLNSLGQWGRHDIRRVVAPERGRVALAPLSSGPRPPRTMVGREDDRAHDVIVEALAFWPLTMRTKETTSVIGPRNPSMRHPTISRRAIHHQPATFPLLRTPAAHAEHV